MIDKAAARAAKKLPLLFQITAVFLKKELKNTKSYDIIILQYYEIICL